MKQVLQDLQSGAVVVAETPEPAPARGRLLVRVQASLLSAGTESAQVAKARQSLLEKVREKPELLRGYLISDDLEAADLCGCSRSDFPRARNNAGIRRTEVLHFPVDNMMDGLAGRVPGIRFKMQ